MKRRSWHELQNDPKNDSGIDPEISAPDVGWVNQMRFLLTEYAAPNSRVLDPFAGFGTTLVACELEGHESYGIELDPLRVEQANARLKKAGKGEGKVQIGNATDLPFANDSFDLVLTSIPYFGATRSDLQSDDDLYAEQSYRSYLMVLERTVIEMKRVLKSGGLVVAAAENIRIDGDHFIPLAWDFASMIAKHFRLRDERILIYQPRSNGLKGEKDRFETDRSHEYVLIGERVWCEI